MKAPQGYQDQCAGRISINNNIVLDSNLFTNELTVRIKN